MSSITKRLLMASAVAAALALPNLASAQWGGPGGWGGPGYNNWGGPGGWGGPGYNNWGGRGWNDGYGSGYGRGNGYGYGYPNGYRPGYAYGYADPYYTDPYNAALGPYPYAYGYGSGYNPYPRYVVVPCADNNRDGRCDSRPPKGRDQHGDRHDGDPGRGDRPRAVPAPAPVVQQPARVRPESRRALPPDATAPRAPRVGRSRPSTTSDDVALSRPTQEP